MSCGLLLSLLPFTQILHHQLRGIILYKSCGLLLSLSPFTQIIHNWLRETILYKSCGLLLSLSSVTWILHHQLRGIISYSVNAGFKRFYRVVFKSSTIFGSKFLVLKSRLIHRKIRYVPLVIVYCFLFWKNQTEDDIFHKNII